MTGRLPSRIATAIARLPQEYRWEATRAIGVVLAGHPGDELSALSGVARSNQEPDEHRVASIWAISRCWPPGVIVESLAPVLDDRSASAGVRSAAAEGFSCADRTATEFLVRAMDAKEPFGLREVAITSIGALGDPSALPALARLLRDEAELVSLRALAAEAIGEIAVFMPETTAEAIAILSEVAAPRNPPALTQGVARALANLATREAGPVLRRLLPEIDQSDIDLREHVESALAEIDDSE